MTTLFRMASISASLLFASMLFNTASASENPFAKKVSVESRFGEETIRDGKCGEGKCGDRAMTIGKCGDRAMTIGKCGDAPKSKGNSKARTNSTTKCGDK